MRFRYSVSLQSGETRWHHPVQMTPPDPCPADPEMSAEARLLDRMPPEQATSFDQHLWACARCFEVFEETRRYIEAMREAGKWILDEEINVD